MNNLNRIIKSALLMAFVVMLAFTSGCDDDDDPGAAVDNTEVRRVFELLSGDAANPTVWNVSEVLVDDLDFSSTYPGLSLSFAEGTYTSVNGGGIFAPSGTWAFSSTAAEQIVIDGDLVMDVVEITENTLAVGFTWTQTTLGLGGRSESVSGVHVISFTK